MFAKRCALNLFIVTLSLMYDYNSGSSYEALAVMA